ncbi:MAG: hypothetical protein F6J87_14570 [Spirulina sp. SIO3F2]|nr:hypothetical protein [Spirulina sp. SIO3F2]
MKSPQLTTLLGAGLMAAASTLVPGAALAEVTITLTGEMHDICAEYDANGAACACYLEGAWEGGNFEFTANDVADALSWTTYDDEEGYYYNDLLQGCIDAN